LWAHLQVYWKAVRMRRRQALWVIKRCCKDICLSQESLYDSTHSCSLWFRAQELNEDWCFWTHSDRNLLSVADVRAVTPCCLLVAKLFSAEESYETHDLELLVIVEAFKQWHHYLEKNTHSVKVLTDHNNLCGFMNIKMLNEQQTQWAVRLAAFDFVIKHRQQDKPHRCAVRRSDYVEAISENIDRLLSTLQRKLAAMPATMFKFWWLSVILRQFVKLVKSKLTWGLENSTQLTYTERTRRQSTVSSLWMQHSEVA
jgi:hypothetical protein